MRFKGATILMLVVARATLAFAEDAAVPDETPREDAELEAEISYVEKLVGSGYSDLAGPVIEATKRRWPDSEVRFFAIEIRGMLALGKFEEAEKKIAALPDRKSAKFWAARLEVAQNYFYRGQKSECMKIYEEFFKAIPKPSPALRKFHMEASYSYGQLLIEDQQYEKALACYAPLVARLPKGGNERCNVSCETVELCLRLAGAQDGKNGAKREGYLKQAEGLVDQLLWLNEAQPLYFGRAVSMKAHIAEMRGDVARAGEIIDDYRPQLQEIHDQIVAADPEGNEGLLKQSPLPECLYLQAKMLWGAAQAEFRKQPKRDDEKVKSCLFGPKASGGRRKGSRGAFNMATSVFLNYETSAWAPAAGELSEQIKAFAEKEYKAKIKTNVTPEQIAKVRAAQFKEANERFLAQKYDEAIKLYYGVLAKYPECKEAVLAIENIASACLDVVLETKDEAKKEAFRFDADVVEGYLAERFAEAKDKVLMMAAGDAVVRLAAKESQYRNMARADRLYTAFLTNYRRHTGAATLAASKAGELQKQERWADALKYWRIIAECYTNTAHYATALSQISRCSGALGDKAGEIGYIKKYLDVETVQIRRLQARFNLAKMYQKDGLDILASAETNQTPEQVEQDERRGTAQIIRAVKAFTGFVAEVEAALGDPSLSKENAAKYGELKEAAMCMSGVCWSRMNRPEKNLKTYREHAAQSYETYVAAFPTGKYAKVAYVQLGTVYTALGDMEKSRAALDLLAKKFPDSKEAKDAKPRLAKNLIDMGMKKEGAEVYAEMLRTDGSYTAGQFVSAGEALIMAKSWDLANQAFEKAIRLAGTNQVVVAARARLGQAKSSWKQGSFAEAREALDLFLADPKMARMAIAAEANLMLVSVASDQGRVEKDTAMRTKCFNAAIGALKKVRQYWKSRPQWKQDELDLLSGDVLVDRMKAEDAMGLKAEALDSCERAASVFQMFIASHGVNEAHPLDKMEPGEVANLQRAYERMIPLLSRCGADQAERTVRACREYLELFPNGKARTAVENCMNKAKADLPAENGQVKK